MSSNEPLMISETLGVANLFLISVISVLMMSSRRVLSERTLWKYSISSVRALISASSFSLKTRKTAESHVYDMLSLLVSKAETLAHTHLGLSLGT